MKDKKNNLFVKLSVYVDTADDETSPKIHTPSLSFGNDYNNCNNCILQV